MTKNNRGGLIAGIIVLFLIAASFGVFLVFAIGHFGGFNFGGFSLGESNHLALEKEFELDNVNLISSDSDTANIHISKSTDGVEKVKVHILAEEKVKVSAEKNDSSIDIYAKEECHFICFGQKKSTIDIVLPENYEGDFKIKSDAGDIDIDDFEKASLDLDADAGNNKIGKLKAITANVDTGKVEIKGAENINVEIDAGDLRINECTNKLYVKNDTGNVEIDNLSLKEDSTVIVDVGNIKINNVGDVRVDVNKSVGNSSVNGGNPKADVNLTVKADVGNIDIR
ncbi:MAG: DUF4097 family beta strand repeat-containing protein [Candidatus Saccharibacteria bacterium]|nr:DUF4097 family beta strand repeat-containing protein [Candidatus Saccharibacteria bacterium]